MEDGAPASAAAPAVIVGVEELLCAVSSCPSSAASRFLFLPEAMARGLIVIVMLSIAGLEVTWLIQQLISNLDK